MLERREAPIAAGAAAIQGGASGSAIVGYAAIFYDANDRAGTTYRLDAVTEERIAPTAFDAALREKHDVRLLLNHDANHVLARTASRTLTLSTDRRGLRFRADLDPSNPSSALVLSAVRRGDLSGASFAFNVLKERYDRGDKGRIRWLESVALSDVSVVAYPAYASTSAALSRSLSDLRKHRARLWRLLTETQAPEAQERLHDAIEYNEIEILRAMVAR